jgi:hypothetical protein
MMFMLDERYAAAESKPNKEWKDLDKFFGEINIKDSAFISLNWDTVVERRLAKRRGILNFNYRCGATAAEFPGRGRSVSDRSFPDDARGVSVVKIHGSVNWLYCDSCRQLYWFRPDQAATVATQLITGEEGDRLKLHDTEGCAKWRCLNCPDVPLTTRIATFSFLKALDFPMFERSWLSAEQLLRDAEKWVFVGYSLPAADFEFKHLLKRVQLSRQEAPEFVLITGGSPESCEATYSNYQKFFGRGIKKGRNVFMDGLSDAAIAAAT